jgi:hypothetical protein
LNQQEGNSAPDLDGALPFSAVFSRTDVYNIVRYYAVMSITIKRIGSRE